MSLSLGRAVWRSAILLTLETITQLDPVTQAEITEAWAGAGNRVGVPSTAEQIGVGSRDGSVSVGAPRGRTQQSARRGTLLVGDDHDLAREATLLGESQGRRGIAEGEPTGDGNL